MLKSRRGAAAGEAARAQKEESRRRLIAAAEASFRKSGYLAPSVDDIARLAGVTRQTFYRHFDSKLAVAIEYFALRREEAMELWSGLTDTVANDTAATEAWLVDMLAFHRNHRQDVRALFEISIFEPAFMAHASALVPQIIDGLAGRVVAFAAINGDSAKARRLRAEAWLLVYQIIDQCANTAMGFCVIEERLLVDILTESIVSFVRRNTVAKPPQPALRTAKG
jgi:AcrR family transcriptional regulator